MNDGIVHSTQAVVKRSSGQRDRIGSLCVQQRGMHVHVYTSNIARQIPTDAMNV
jgi:ribosomal protein L27